MRQGMTVEELAVRCDLARSTIREIIAGRSDTRVLSLRAIATALGFADLTEFLGPVSSALTPPNYGESPVYRRTLKKVAHKLREWH
jgi:transcriptional regulator with XRE-family HTH domain